MYWTGGVGVIHKTTSTHTLSENGLPTKVVAQAVFGSKKIATRKLN